MRDIRKVGSIGIKTVVYYLLTTACAIVMGLLMGQLMKGFFPVLSTTDLQYEAKASASFMDTLVGIFPSNFLAPMVNANMLQIIVMALFLGFGIILVGDKAEGVRVLIEELNTVFMKIMELILKLSPIGVFCLLTPVVAENGAEIIGSLAMVLLTAYISYIVHAVIVYSLSVKTLAGLNPIKFFKGMAPAMAMAFSSASSVGTLPINMNCAEKLGAKKDVVSFVLPLGATINMDGTAIMQGVATVFIAQVYGVELTISQLAVVVLTAVLASIGTAGVPGVGLVMLTMVLNQVNLPVEGIALIIGIDRILDMSRTAVNISGDAICAMIVAKSEEKYNTDQSAAS